MIGTIETSCKMIAVLAVGVTGGMATERAVDTATHVPMGVVVSVVVTAVGIAIAISRAMQKLQDSLDDLKGHVDKVEKRLEMLPCHNQIKCQNEDDKG